MNNNLEFNLWKEINELENRIFNLGKINRGLSTALFISVGINLFSLIYWLVM